MTLNPWPYFNADQIDLVRNVLVSGKVNYWTGSETRLFEEEFASYSGSSYALAVANGSLALSVIYAALGFSSEDEFITTPRTFIATSSCGALFGARPIFVDVNYESGCIDADTIEPAITSRTKAIVVVHLGGWPANMPSIIQLAETYNLPVIEDCSQAHGASIYGTPVGSFGLASAWSFCQDKIISTGGEGGMITTSNQMLYEHMWSLKDHGKSITAITSSSKSSSFRWLHDSFGNNCRMTEMQSVLGRYQLNHLSMTTFLRNRNASILIDKLSDLSIVSIPQPPEGFVHAYYKFYAYIVPTAMSSSWSRDKVVKEICAAGFPAFSGGCSEIYLEKCFQLSGFSPDYRLPNARSLGETSIMLLVHHTITEDQMRLYAATVRHVLQMATRKA